MMSGKGRGAESVQPTIAKLEDFLVSLANTKDRLTRSYERDYGPMRLLLKKFPEVFPPSFPADSSIARDRQQLHDAISAAGALQLPRTAAERETDSLDGFIKWARLLRSAWDQPDLRLQEWLLFELRSDFHRTVNPGSTDPPDKTFFEQAMVHFQHIAQEGRAKHCANRECNQLQYFIAINSRYKFCSEECAAPSQRRYKRTWWDKRGKKLRAQERKNAKKR